ECPAAAALITAHKQLEQLVLTRSELKFKESVDAVWSELVYTGLWTEPLREDLDAFIDKTQERVTGKVRLRMHSKSCSVVSRESPYALYSEKVASFDEKADQHSIEGMLRYHALQAALYEKVRKK
ncbi:MAG: argininosuccinate synthase, partial [Candidatus Hydrothermarchaeota archaeon]|nr:argininosuccinate synthase [Candidatus Hydrothermarchaeota archaeon]